MYRYKGESHTIIIKYADHDWYTAADAMQSKSICANPLNQSFPDHFLQNSLP